MPKRVLQGVVVGDKADKTISVEVVRTLTHPKYKKIIKTVNSFHKTIFNIVSCF